MQEFHALIGAYVRSYCEMTFEAKSMKAALPQAIAKYKQNDRDVTYRDTDYENVALPCVVSLERMSDRKLIVEGHDFALNENDARDLHAQELLNIARLTASGCTDVGALKDAATKVLADIEAAYPSPQNAGAKASYPFAAG
jgi:hypothetical protein